jgi:hypothetical protein
MRTRMLIALAVALLATVAVPTRRGDAGPVVAPAGAVAWAGDRASAGDIAPAGGVAWTASGLTPDQVAIVEWAVERYAAAGLALGPFAVVAHDSTEPCLGRPAAHTVVDGRSVVHLCAVQDRPVAEWTMLHELGHAWDVAALTEPRREAFLEVRSLVAWRNDDPERWAERGAEHAAEVLVWGLMDRPVRLVRFSDTSCVQLLTAFVVLTGHLPADLHDRCARSPVEVDAA